MFKKPSLCCLVALLNLFTGQSHLVAQTLDPANLTGVYVGDYQLIMRAAPTGAILGKSVQRAKWRWDFDNNSATIAGNTLSVGFNYALHDVEDASIDNDILYFDNNGDGTYRLYYSLQIYHPGLGNPMASTSTTFRITTANNQLQINTIDAEEPELDGIIGTKITNVFPLTIEPDLQGVAVQALVDSNNDGLTDQIALTLGLDPSNNDSDQDGLDNISEIGADVNTPLDSDNDGIIDALEFSEYAFNAQVGKALTLISGDYVNLTSSSTWALTAIMAGSMQHKVDNLENINDIVNTDSTLGDPGLDYNYGNISFTSYQIESDNRATNTTITLNFSTPLPDKLLLYSIQPDSENGSYHLLAAETWQRIDNKSIVITMSDGGISDIDQIINGRVSLSIAITGNNLGGIQRDENSSAGSFSWLLILMLLSLNLRVYQRRGN
ncbi:choice-of-anchor U domain-containing protein [Psychromonas sp. Urea-02u-13]|uniref:choice-of-anchor U domain-containing protein n=1 Tax=Psychromonas sp. Urea-02u-13 TaxID=2058326 RepID=UPI000C31FA56|nr:choice-of-anchor U domain-containing protein [Psychromonas sp. Urea-02u-13]PKG39243.1 hypothetical protein CXF74_09390 [Psychromonas sp. Urea-02u-13]